MCRSRTWRGPGQLDGGLRVASGFVHEVGELAVVEDHLVIGLGLHLDLRVTGHRSKQVRAASVGSSALP
eukprot:190057-Chlamydomonas_euryale.AAC.2